MARAGVLPRAFARIEPSGGTPNVAVTVVTLVALAIAIGGIEIGAAPIDIFNNCGTLSSFGFILIYMMIAVAAAVYSRKLGAFRYIDLAVSLVAFVLLALTAVTLFYPVPAPPQRWFGYIFAVFVLAGWLWFLRARASAAPR
jgi:amino acid transporter